MKQPPKNENKKRVIHLSKDRALSKEDKKGQLRITLMAELLGLRVDDRSLEDFEVIEARCDRSCAHGVTAQATTIGTFNPVTTSTLPCMV
jgi:hypothetical protein